MDEAKGRIEKKKTNFYKFFFPKGYDNYSNINPFEVNEADIDEIKFDKEKYNRLMIKTELEDYKDDLWNLGLTLKRKDLYEKQNPDSIKKELDEITTISNTFLFAIKNKNNLLTISNLSNNKIDVDKETSKIVLEEIEKAYRKKIEHKNLNQYTYDEAEALLKSGSENDWIESYWNSYADYVGLSYEEKISTPPEDIEIEMIEEFIYDNPIPMENITINQIEAKTKEFTDGVFLKKGRKQKNRFVEIALLILSSILKAKRLIKSKGKMKRTDYPPSNDLRLINEYVLFFNLKDDKSPKWETLKQTYNSSKKSNAKLYDHLSTKIRQIENDIERLNQPF